MTAKLLIHTSKDVFFTPSSSTKSVKFRTLSAASGWNEDSLQAELIKDLINVIFWSLLNLNFHLNTWKICVPQWGRRKQHHLPNNSASQHSPPLPSPVSQTWLTNADIFGDLAKQQPPLELIVCLPSCQLCLTPVISRIACLPARLANPPSHPVCPAHVLAISSAKPFPRFLHLSPSDYLSDNVHIRRFTRVDLIARFIWLPIALTPESESKTEERSCQRRLSKLRVKLSAHPWTFVPESPPTFISDGGGLRLCSSPELVLVVQVHLCLFKISAQGLLSLATKTLATACTELVVVCVF